jgi:hypothetical protein
MPCPCQYFIIPYNSVFVTVCYFYATEIFLLELRDEKWGGGDLGPLLLFTPFWHPHFISPSLHRGVRTRKNGTKSDACLTRYQCTLEDGTFPSIDLIGAVSHDFLYKFFKLAHGKCLQPLS